jgi:hypothetical protein
MKKHFFINCLVAGIIFSVSLISCEKNRISYTDEEGIENMELIGSWVRVDTISVHQRSYKYLYTRELTYLASNKYFDKIDYLKVDSNLLNPENKGFQSVTGKYSIHGNKIVHTALEASFFEEDFPESTRTEKYPNANAKDSMSYTIIGKVYTQNYLSYPNDAPMETIMVFKRK